MSVRATESAAGLCLRHRERVAGGQARRWRRDYASVMPDEAKPPVRPLSAREAGTPADETLHEGVPAHLLRPLEDWTTSFLTSALLDRVAATLRRPLGEASFADVQQLCGYRQDGTRDHDRLLDVIDVALQLDERLHIQVAAIGMEENEGALIAHQEFVLPAWLMPEYIWPRTSDRARAVADLDQLLVDGGSAYEVRWRVPTMLVRRVDPTVKVAVDETISIAPPTAAEHLVDAWAETYGRQPDPTTAYRQAVRAVEEIACPLFLPKDDGATLGKVVSHLAQGGATKWAFALVNRDGNDDIGPVVEMLSRLWWGQVSRHGGGKKSRDQTQGEAEAAVHLAATLMQWLGNDGLTRRP